jgi:hypothetical protein
MFVKREKMNPKAKRNPDPRAIQFRDPRYCVELARYLKPIEHHLYRVEGDGSYYPASRMVGKGLNQVERAMLLREKMSRFRDPVVISLDASRFDKHVSRPLLEIEHSVYLYCNRAVRFAQLLHMQLKNFVKSDSGMIYVCEGRRMSGDMNTALGNCILMLIMVGAFMSEIGCQWDILDDGDDCLVIVDRCSRARVLAECAPAFLSFGMTIKVEAVVDHIEDVEWCQSKPVEYAPQKFKFVRDWTKVVSQDLVGTKWLGASHCRPRLLQTIGLCELILNMGVPILQEYSIALIRNAHGAQPLGLDQSPLWHRVKHEARLFGRKHLTKLAPQPITDEARLSFQRAFGVSVTDQLLIESSLKSWTFPCVGDKHFEHHFDVQLWSSVRVDRCEATFFGLAA